MSWYLSRTDGELVALARQGDRPARAVLVDRTLLPASRVAMHLEPDANAAVAALVAAYGDAFRRVAELADDEAFLPVLLDRLDHRAPFPLDPATHAPLDPVDRDRVRAAVLGADRGRRAVPLAAALAALAVLAVVLTGGASSTPAGLVVDDAPPVGGPASDAPTNGEDGRDLEQATPEPSPTDQETGTPDGGTSVEPDGAGADDDRSDDGGGDGAADDAVAVDDGGTGTGELAETP